jgi:hypothetical protein
LNEEFGFYINRPFYIRSRLPMRRLAEMHGNTYIYQYRWNNSRKAQQQWVFMEDTKMIRNNHWKNYYMFIQSNGGGTYSMTNTAKTSRWW